MDCIEFLSRYSEYVDGVGGAGAAAFERHLGSCPSCARYHRVVREGCGLLRQLPPVHASEDFLPRLRHKLFHLEDELSRRPALTGSTVMGAVLILGFVAAAWVPALLHRHEVVLPPIVVEAPSRPEPARLVYTPLWVGVESSSLFRTPRRPSLNGLRGGSVVDSATPPSLWDSGAWGRGGTAAALSLSDEIR
jgi:anti-sigma factor RsiW